MSYLSVIPPPFFIDILKDICRDVKSIKKELKNHSLVLEEVVERLRNRGAVLLHPKSMPTLPIDSYENFKKMEVSLETPSNLEYLVS